MNIVKIPHYDKLLPLKFLGGSSSLVTGKYDEIIHYFSDMCESLNSGSNEFIVAHNYPHIPVLQGGNWGNIDVLYDSNMLSPEELFSSAESLHETLTGKFVFIAVTREEIEKYNQIEKDGNWLTEYAIYADSYAERNGCDIFLNLDWDLSREELPSLFWLVFDRIFECELTEENELIVIETRKFVE